MSGKIPSIKAESVTYQEMVGEGIEIGLRRGAQQALQEAILLSGHERFGKPNEEVVNAIHSVTDVDRLRRMLVRLLHVSSWQELLSEAQPSRPRISFGDPPPGTLH